MSYEPTVIMTGTACMDEYYHLDRWICEGDKTEVRYISSEMGGMIANAACVLAGLGTYTPVSYTHLLIKKQYRYQKSQN